MRGQVIWAECDLIVEVTHIIIIIIHIKSQNKERGSRIKCHRVTMHVSNARKTNQNVSRTQRQLTKLDN